jgi:glycosyltransferase involved in cell wall biosynthesis
MLRITLVSPDIYPYTAGYGGRNPYDIAKSLSEFGHKVTVLASIPKFTMGSEGQKNVFQLYTYRLLSKGNSYFNYYLPLQFHEYVKFFRKLKSTSKNTDIFIVNGSLESLSLAFFLCVPKSLRGKIIFINHGLPKPDSFLLRGISFYLHSIFGRILFSGIRGVISYSEISEKLLRATISKGNNIKFNKINLGVDCKEFMENIKKIEYAGEGLCLKLKSKFNIGRNFIYSVGRFEKNKGYDILLESFRIICNEYQDIQLVITGEITNYGELLLMKFKDLILDNKVLITGRLEEEFKLYLMMNCSLYVIPSVREGFGGGAIEATILGIRTVATNTGNMASTLVNSVIVQPNSIDELVKGIRKALSSPNLKNFNSEEKCKQFSVDNISRLILDMYHDKTQTG